MGEQGRETYATIFSDPAKIIKILRKFEEYFLYIRHNDEKWEKIVIRLR